MKVIAEDLRKKLEILNLLINSKSLVENCESFNFDKKNVYSFNGDIFIQTPLETNFSGSIQGKIFYNLLQKFNVHTINIEQNEEQLILKKQRAIIKFSFGELVNKPSLINSENNKWRKLPNEFLEGANTCSNTCGTDYTDMRTVCIHFKENFIESTDSFRITLFECKEKFDYEFLITVDTIKILNKMNPIWYFKDDSWVHFKNETQTIVSTRIVELEQSYPKLLECINSFDNFKTILLPQKIYNSLEKINILLSEQIEQDKFIEVNCSNKYLTINTLCPGIFFKEKMKVDFSGTFAFNINPSFLMQVIEKTNEIQICEKALKLKFKNQRFLTALSNVSGETK